MLHTATHPAVNVTDHQPVGHRSRRDDQLPPLSHIAKQRGIRTSDPFQRG